MRLGGPVFAKHTDPAGWIAEVRKLGYSAAFCPLSADASDDEVRAYEAAAREADVVIAEVGAWSNPIDADDTKRREAIAHNEAQLALADRIGARCCVNVSGSRGTRWAGPHVDNLTDDTFDLVVETVRKIIDAVKPTRAFYTLETMPWMVPDTPDSYVRLIDAIDRERFAAHFDPVNLISSPQRYFYNADLIRECFAKLGPKIKSCHAKDILLADKLTVHLDEVCPGDGGLDYGVFLAELDRLDADTPLMLEHMKAPEDYARGAAHIRRCADEGGIILR